MQLTLDLITAFHRCLHRCLHRACGLPSLRPSMSDIQSWRDFLREMEPLEDEEAGGPLTERDIIEVVGEMARQNQKGQTGWSLRPVKILRDPEAFRDLVLLARKRRSARPRPPATRIEEQRHGTTRRLVEVPNETEAITPGEALAALHAAMGRPQT